MYVSLSSCTPTTAQHKHTLFVFGTLIEITLADISAQLAEKTFLQLEQDFQQYHNDWTPWQDSDLTRTNTALQSGKEFALPASIEPLIRQSQTHYINSEGLFNPAIGKLIKRWRFHQFDQPGIRPPDAASIRSLLKAQPKITDIDINKHMAISSNAAVDLNFGAFAKGYAIDLAMQKLQRAGINAAVINAGGDLSVIGRHGEREWQIGIRQPRDNGILASITAHHGDSVFTSGDYERFYYYQGVRYHHILDPRTGYPADGATSVTVIDADAGTADAAATALLIAGADDMVRIARNMGIAYVMLVDQQGTVYMNPAMAERVEFQISPLPRIVLTETL
jgi:thiamine biosynthesis lipoprotein